MNGPVRICARCDKPTHAPVAAVAEVHGNSGPGRTVYACPDCAPHYPEQCHPLSMLDTIAKRCRSREANQ